MKNYMLCINLNGLTFWQRKNINDETFFEKRVYHTDSDIMGNIYLQEIGKNYSFIDETTGIYIDFSPSNNNFLLNGMLVSNSKVNLIPYKNAIFRSEVILSSELLYNDYQALVEDFAKYSIICEIIFKETGKDLISYREIEEALSSKKVAHL